MGLEPSTVRLLDGFRRTPVQADPLGGRQSGLDGVTHERMGELVLGPCRPDLE